MSAESSAATTQASTTDLPRRELSRKAGRCQGGAKLPLDSLGRTGDGLQSWSLLGCPVLYPGPGLTSIERCEGRAPDVIFRNAFNNLMTEPLPAIISIIQRECLPVNFHTGSTRKKWQVDRKSVV